MKQLMENHPVNIESRTNTRLEHVDFPSGKDYTRCYYFVRGSEPGSSEVSEGLDSGRLLNPTKGRLHQALNWIERRLFFWR